MSDDQRTSSVVPFPNERKRRFANRRITPTEDLPTNVARITESPRWTERGGVPVRPPAERVAPDYGLLIGLAMFRALPPEVRMAVLQELSDRAASDKDVKDLVDGLKAIV